MTLPIVWMAISQIMLDYKLQKSLRLMLTGDDRFFSSSLVWAHVGFLIKY